MSEVHLEGDKIVSRMDRRWRCRGRLTQITPCEATPHRVGQRMRGLTTRRETWAKAASNLFNISVNNL
jgi:hypothetical protein